MQPTEKAGLFSVVRYVPDDFRDEGVNVGVVLVCPDADSVIWKIGDTDSHKRLQRILGHDAKADLHRLRAMENGLRANLEANGRHLLENNAFDDFAKRVRNHLQLTDPRPCIVEDPNTELSELYSRLVSVGSVVQQVDGDVSTFHLNHLRAQFSERLRERGIYDKLKRDVSIKASYRTRPYHFSYSYKNGRVHVLHEAGFARKDEDTNCDRAFVLASEIEDVRQHQGEHEFKILAAFSDDQPKAKKVIEQLFRDRGVSLWTPSTMDDLVSTVQRDLESHHD